MTRDAGYPFPLDMLTQPSEVRQKYFGAQVYRHYLFDQVLNETLQMINSAEPGSILLLYGPTRVGKTTLKKMLIKYLLAASLEEMKQDPGLLPVAEMKATAQDHRPFDWLDYYVRALMALNEPLVERKILADTINFGVPEVQLNGQGRLIIKSGTQLRKLRLALENCLAHRRPKVFIVDEAPHMQRIANPNNLRTQLDTIKSLAEASGAIHLLLGTYDLLNFTNLNGQLAARSKEIDFRRYRAGCEEDEKNFQRLLKSFEQSIPLAETPDLVKHWELFLNNSLGLVGIVKQWLSYALGEAMNQKAQILTDEILKKHQPTSDKLRAIFEEVRNGENRLKEKRERDAEQLAKWMELDRVANKELEQAKAKKKAKSKSKEKEPKPRLPIGVPNEGLQPGTL